MVNTRPPTPSGSHLAEPDRRQRRDRHVQAVEDGPAFDDAVADGAERDGSRQQQERKTEARREVSQETGSARGHPHTVIGMRVGIVGCGFIANVHSWALWAVRKAEQADVTVVAVCDRRRRACRGARSSTHEADVLDVESLLDAVDVVYICTPTAEHLALVEAAAARGLAVFCEKPLAPTLDQARTVAAALAKVPHQVGLVLRSSPVFTELRSEIASGRHGRVDVGDDARRPVLPDPGRSTPPRGARMSASPAAGR